ncbi:unnamed protein product [Spodoptera exigua]|uniref:Uncharacterized protein n=1 Tax=Spodoptera exigua TaxID=7107 RepID=A0A835GUM3_SPOEX|nr:hypothetical protein HW555_000409 [Spodoptera exigua]KAH9638918.1 hypothetical protein HF086_013817 [Spodoptera exigua]CAH0694502.1 unnamed protein product [Spodoptera exigua]
MKCNEFDNSKSRHMNLENLDKALHDLGMLSAITEARRDYLRESKTNYSVMRFNTRYVSNVTVGYCMKRATNKNRLCPYVLPIRHRTKSENSDAIGSDVSDSGCEYKNSLLEPSTSGYKHECVKSPAKRCQSLENLNLAAEGPPRAEPSPDMDCVSTRIQKLQVDE